MDPETSPCQYGNEGSLGGQANKYGEPIDRQNTLGHQRLRRKSRGNKGLQVACPSAMLPAGELLSLG